jgi:hypothetical protein
MHMLMLTHVYLKSMWQWTEVNNCRIDNYRIEQCSDNASESDKHASRRSQDEAGNKDVDGAEKNWKTRSNMKKARAKVAGRAPSSVSVFLVAVRARGLGCWMTNLLKSFRDVSLSLILNRILQSPSSSETRDAAAAD